jgi:protein-tyrosine-phosphatase
VLKILFVCSGNTCRSPLAEVLARRLLADEGLDGVEVDSAGAFAADGSPASTGAREAARDAGLDLTRFRSQRLTEEHVDGADLIVVMEPAHRSAVLGLVPTADTKTHLLGELAGEDGARAAVPDPFGGDAATYRRTFRRIDELLAAARDTIAELARRKSR